MSCCIRQKRSVFCKNSPPKASLEAAFLRKEPACWERCDCALGIVLRNMRFVEDVGEEHNSLHTGKLA